MHQCNPPFIPTCFLHTCPSLQASRGMEATRSRPGTKGWAAVNRVDAPPWELVHSEPPHRALSTAAKHRGDFQRNLSESSSPAGFPSSPSLSFQNKIRTVKVCVSTSNSFASVTSCHFQCKAKQNTAQKEKKSVNTKLRSKFKGCEKKGYGPTKRHTPESLSEVRSFG